jgi:hypothetical protein
MDPRAVLHPVGPRPAHVYWARRLLVLAVVAVLVVGVVQVFAGGGDAKPAAVRPSPTSTAASPSPSPAGLAACRRHDLSVAASTDAPSYPGGALPHLTAVVRNTSADPCRFRTAAGRRVWTISSGADKVWSSADCNRSSVVAGTRLRPGKTVVYTLVWNRHRSAAGCPATTPTAQPGTYRLDVTVNHVAARTVVFHLTG